MASKVNRPAPTPLPVFADTDSKEHASLAEGATIEQQKPMASNTFQQQELQHALETINMYEQQVNGLLSSLRQADANWEKAEQVRVSVACAISCILNDHKLRAHAHLVLKQKLSCALHAVECHV